MKQNLILIRGLPGCGKSTHAAKLMNDGIVSAHFEADQFFMVDGEYRFDASQLGKAHAKCLSDTENAIKNGESVVVSNTFTTLRELIPYIDLAYQNNISIGIIDLNTQNFGSLHNVPAQSLKRMQDRYFSAEELIRFFGNNYQGLQSWIQCD